MTMATMQRNRKNSPHYLYLFKFKFEGDTVYKIGVTGNRPNDRLSSLGFPGETVYSWLLSREEAFKYEKEFLKETKENGFLWNGDAFLVSGNTELFQIGYDTEEYLIQSIDKVIKDEKNNEAELFDLLSEIRDEKLERARLIFDILHAWDIDWGLHLGDINRVDIRHDLSKIMQEIEQSALS